MSTSTRRLFLKRATTALAASRVVQPQATAPRNPSQAPPIAPPKQARVTSSVMLWTLKGPFEDRLSVAAQVGMQSVELVTEHLTWSDADVVRYKNLARSYGLGMDALLGQPDWTKRPVTLVNPAHRDGFLSDMREAITWAKKLDVTQIIVMSGNVQPKMSHEAQHASMVEGAKRATDLADAADLKLILEPLNSRVNHKGYFLTSCKEGLAVVKEVNNPHFRLLFDIYHEYVQNGDPVPTINEALPYVSVFHVADAPGRHDPGTGTMNWNAIYETIGKGNYTGYIAMEYLPIGNEVDSLTKAVTQMRERLNSATPQAAPAPQASLEVIEPSDC